MVKYAKAKEGNEFVLTEFGFEQGHVRDKFNKNGANYARYRRIVPEAWVNKGYVVEVKDGEK